MKQFSARTIGAIIAFLAFIGSPPAMAQMTGEVTGKNASSISLAGNGTDLTNFMKLVAPANSLAGITITLPTTTGSSGNMLTTNGSGTLSWAAPGTGAVTTFSAGTTGLTPSSATTGAITLAGTLIVANGGTGATTETNHGVLLGAGTGAFTATAAGTAGQILTSSGASASPTWTTAAFPSTGGTSGTILRSDGTNFVNSTATYPNTATTGDLLYASGTNVVGNLAVGGATTVLIGGTTPAYQALSIGATLSGNAVTTALGIDLTHANTWTGTQTFGGHAFASSTPTTLAANTNDWALSASSSYFLIAASAAYNVTGIASGADGREIRLVNTGSNAITLTEQDASSSAANRIITATGNIILAANGSVLLTYDGTASRWRVFGGNN